MSILENRILDYIVAVIGDFASKFSISTSQAYRYLLKYSGIDFLLNYYDVEHTFSFEDIVDDVSEYCHNRGGELI